MAPIIGQGDCGACDTCRLGNSAGAEGLELVIAEPFEAGLLTKCVEVGQREFLDVLRQLRCEGSSVWHRPRVDPDDSPEQLRDPVCDDAHRSVGAAVPYEDDVAIGLFDKRLEGIGLVLQSRVRAVGILPVKARQSDGVDVKPPLPQSGHHVIPGPCTQPVTGNEDDVWLVCCIRCHVIDAVRGPGQQYGTIYGMNMTIVAS